MKRVFVGSGLGFCRAAILGGCMIFAGAEPALACGANPYIGEICIFAASYCPVGYAVADNSEITFSTNSELGKLLGNIYGGSNIAFALPDLRNVMMVGSPSWTAIGGAVGGRSTTLVAANLPSHSHILATAKVTVSATSVTVPFNAIPAAGATPTVPPGSTVYPTNARGGAGPSALRGVFTTTAPTSFIPSQMPVSTSGGVAISGATGPSGGGAPLPIQSPALALTVCIATQGASLTPSN